MAARRGWDDWREPGPRLVATAGRCAVGYGPRTIVVSADRRSVLVGCKDGSVTAIALDALPAPSGELAGSILAAPAKRPVGVRALCDLGGRLLIGSDSGEVRFVRWDPSERRAAPAGCRELASDVRDQALSYIGRWGDSQDRILISPRATAARLVQLDEDRGRLDTVQVLTGVEALVGAYLLPEGHRLLISKTGALWLHGAAGKPLSLTDLWRKNAYEQPSYVFDVSAVRLDLEIGSPAAGVYLSTTEGVFLLTLGRSDQWNLEQVHLPGMSELSQAISHAFGRPRHGAAAAADRYRYLWVSDQFGTVHLFWDGPGESSAEPRWRRSEIRETTYPVLKAVASWAPPAGFEAAVGQACRNDRVWVTWYRRDEAAALHGTRPAGVGARSGGAPPGAGPARLSLSWGSVSELRARREEPASPRRGWCDEALLADFIEELGESDPQELRLFLRNPETDLALGVLREVLAEGGGVERACRAIALWVDTLVGTIHRRVASPSAEDYLGVLRWLRRLERALQGWLAEDQEQLLPRLHAEIEGGILHARKWGLFGASYGTRDDAIGAMVKLDEQSSENRKLDFLVYASLIFRRRINVQQEVAPRQQGTLAPWDLTHLSLTGAEYLAVAMRTHGLPPELPSAPGRIDIYRRDEGDSSWSPLPAITNQPFTRRMLLVKHRGRAYLLTAPVEGDAGPEIVLRELGSPDIIHQLPLTSLLAHPPGAPAAGQAPPAGEESVYSLLALGDGASDVQHVVVGLEGKGEHGGPRLGMLRIDEDLSLHALPPPSDEHCSLRPSYPETQTLRHDPIWSIAAVPDSRNQIVIGCGDGQIWQLDLVIQPESFRIGQTADDAEASRFLGRHYVGRLSAPVWAVACSRPGGMGRLRVFAGGADGAIVAFERKTAAAASSQTGTGTGPPRPDGGDEGSEFATLWATRERAPISRIHPLHLERTGTSPEAVLAITQQGRAVLFSDVPVVELDEPPQSELRHIAVPGERLSRVTLESTVFGSALLGARPWSGERVGIEEWTNLVARVAVATGERKLRLVSLHFPSPTKARHNRYWALLRDLLDRLGNSPPAPGAAGAVAAASAAANERPVYRGPGHSLRRAEVTYAAAPALPVALVRWVLSPNPEPDGGEAAWEERNAIAGPSPAEQWLPRHLRPLARVDRLWAESADGLGEAVRDALASARRAQDLPLLREILEVVLRRANRQLAAEAQRVERGEPLAFAVRYRAILRGIEQERAAWLGWSAEVDARLRMVLAKASIDDKVLWSLSRALSYLRSQPPDAATERQRALALDAMRGQTEQIELSLTRGDDLLALEALHAANLSLLRLCCRLKKEREEGRQPGEAPDWSDRAPWDGSGAASRLSWESVERLYAAVGDYVARSAHQKGSIDDATAHEIARIYALGMLASPPSIFRLGAWMAEADLPPALLRGVRSQLDLLQDLVGLALTERLEALRAGILEVSLQRGSLEDRAPREPAGEPVLAGGPPSAAAGAPRAPDEVREVGTDNVGMMRLRQPFDDIVEWLRRLTGCLTDDASLVDYELTKAPLLLQALGRPAPPTGDQPLAEGEEARDRLWDQWKHSRAFWEACLGDYSRRMEPYLSKDIDPANPPPQARFGVRQSSVRPDAVLASVPLATWCRTWRDDLQRRRREYEMVEPFYTLYGETLVGVERAADRFQKGAAVQKNVVLGVLGHGLLELLDEHVLEMWELAQAVDPERTRRWSRDPNAERSGGNGSTAGRFARYLLDRAQNAETVPTNLRHLQGLLSFRESGAGQGPGVGAFFWEIAERYGWDPRGLASTWERDAGRPDDWKLGKREAHFLGLAIDELGENDRRYALRKQREGPLEAGGSASWCCLRRAPGRATFELHCRCRSSEFELLRRVEELQQPVSRHPDPRRASHGTGLYLANLAAAAVGWKLRWIEDAAHDPPGSGLSATGALGEGEKAVLFYLAKDVAAESGGRDG